MIKKNLIVAYESRFARCGGITAVLNFLPDHLRACSGLTTSVITPFHHRIPETRSVSVRTVGTVKVPFDGKDVEVTLLRHDDRLSWYFLDAQRWAPPHDGKDHPEATDDRFFSGNKHPYDVGANAKEQWAILRRDSLFFGAAVARSLALLGEQVQWNLIMQDWQAACLALALASEGSNTKHSLFLTLHNSYDSGEVWPGDLNRVGISPEKTPGKEPASSILTRVIPLVRKPIFTVSEQFASDFTEDAFQVHVMANHLKSDLDSNLIGVNNGLFVSLAIPDAALAMARAKNSPDYSPLRELKAQRKTAAIKALNEFRPTEDRPAWGNIAAFTQQNQDGESGLPWFVLAGRDDSRQKGYDVACLAISEFLADQANRKKAQFLFFPIPGDEGREGLCFLQELADKHPENVLVLPFIFQEGYLSALQGAAFGIMPSLYEPFGMANEFYLNGAVGIGRATGGLMQQIVPVRAPGSCSPAVAGRSSRWHSESVPSTGLLYREPDDVSGRVEDWSVVNNAGYLETAGRNRLDERRRLPLFQAMASALQKAIGDALDLYNQPPGADKRQPYFAMLVDGVSHLQRGFSWDLAAAEYNSHMQ